MHSFLWAHITPGYYLYFRDGGQDMSCRDKEVEWTVLTQLIQPFFMLLDIIFDKTKNQK